jgi:GcrA cell cycle regulator
LRYPAWQPLFPNFRNNSNSDYQKSSLTLISEYQKLCSCDSGLSIGRAAWKGKSMQSGTWAPEHSGALREFLARGMSYSEIADAINAKFGTSYTRNAAIGRSKRMGLCVPDGSDDRRPGPARSRPPKLLEASLRKLSAPGAEAPGAPARPRERAESVKLRCVGVSPRLLPLIELEDGDCRYPYGGDRDGEAITFCGHPRLAGSSYCAPHFYLTRDDGTAPERAVAPVMLRLVEAA